MSKANACASCKSLVDTVKHVRCLACGALFSDNPPAPYKTSPALDKHGKPWIFSTEGEPISIPAQGLALVPLRDGQIVRAEYRNGMPYSQSKFVPTDKDYPSTAVARIREHRPF